MRKTITSGELIRTRRNKLNISQSQFAKELGYSTLQSISNIERGMVKVPTKKVKIIAKTLKIRPKMLIDVLLDEYHKELRAS